MIALPRLRTVHATSRIALACVPGSRQGRRAAVAEVRRVGVDVNPKGPRWPAQLRLGSRLPHAVDRRVQPVVLVADIAGPRPAVIGDRLATRIGRPVRIGLHVGPQAALQVERWNTKRNTYGKWRRVWRLV